ncbi:MAG: glycosyltransferase family 2 protein [Psychroserpens sp.]|nr:glycosyltransferase family 2 protein [Psychroserpens sp.]
MVSIIIPYYNRLGKLKRTLDSIDRQTYKNVEVIIVDDCSNEENSPELLLTPQIKYIRNKVNQGPGLSRNIGMDHANGDYIAFLDSDDYWNEKFLELTLEALKSNHKAIMAYANGYYVDEQGNVLEEMRKEAPKQETILPNILDDGRPWGTGGCVWDLNQIKDIRWIDSRTWEDYAFDIEVAIRCNTIAYVDSFLVYYDRSDDPEKISVQKDYLKSEIAKNKVLVYITNLIADSRFSNSKPIKSLLLSHALTNCMFLLRLDIKKLDFYKNIRYIYNKMDGKLFLLNERILVGLNKRIIIRFLMFLRTLNL